jgi:hypothetical protein
MLGSDSEAREGDRRRRRGAEQRLRRLRRRTSRFRPARVHFWAGGIDGSIDAIRRKKADFSRPPTARFTLEIGYGTRFPRRSGIVPDLEETILRFVATPVASKLTGLSTEKLREWTSRRALIPADVRPKQKGSPAKFTWQTILVLRLAALLRDQFAVELQAHKATFANLRKELRSTSFIGLWGKRLALAPKGKWFFLDEDTSASEVDALIAHLDPHLAVIRDGFALPDAAAATGQFDLFSLPAMHSQTHRPPHKQSVASGRRRSA